MIEIKTEHLAVLSEIVPEKTNISILNQEVEQLEEHITEMKQAKIIDEYGEITEKYQPIIEHLAKTTQIVDISYIGRYYPFQHALHYYQDKVLSVFSVGDIIQIEDASDEIGFELLENYFGRSGIHQGVCIETNKNEALILAAIFDIQRKYNMYALLKEDETQSFRSIKKEDIKKFIENSHQPSWQWLTNIVKKQTDHKKVNFQDDMSNLINKGHVIERNPGEYSLGTELNKVVNGAYEVQNLLNTTVINEDEQVIYNEMIVFQFGSSDFLLFEYLNEKATFISISSDGILNYLEDLLKNKGSIKKGSV